VILIPKQDRSAPVKRTITLLALIVLAGACAVAEETSTGGGDNPTNVVEASETTEAESPETTEAAPVNACPPTGEDTKNLCWYPDRVDRQADNDHEARIGDPVRLAGYTATVNSATTYTSEMFGDDCIIVNVTVENRDAKTQPYNQFDWKIQTPNGTVEDFCISDASTNGLSSGDLVSGGTVTGDVELPYSGPGTYYVIYKPDPFNAARGIWAVEAD
jgi:hypothetical protein